MSLMVTAEKQYELPAAGLQTAVCVDVVDLGFQKTKFGEKHKVRFVFQVEEMNSRGYRHTVSAWYPLSMHEKSGMRKFLEDWRGKRFGEKELSPPGFDLETVIGKPCIINVVHSDTGYANIGTISPHSSKLGAPLQSENYVRVEDREEQANSATAEEETAPPVPESDLSDDDIPF
jgi:hypothetical protein